MSSLLALVKGKPGKPLHPPLTDASIGAYTVGVAMLVLGTFGVQEEPMAHGALLAIGGGLALAAPTALTGFLDWLDLPAGSPRRTVATVHLFTMVAATVIFALTFATHVSGYDDGNVDTLPLVLGLVGETLLVAGGFLGGTLVFAYGVRVLKRPELAPLDAVVPGRAEPEREPPARPLGGAPPDQLE